MTTAYESGTEPPILVHHRLRIAREYAGLEQEELARLIGISRTTVGNAEKARVKPRRITLNAWALACGVPVGWIINGPGEPLPPDPLIRWYAGRCAKSQVTRIRPVRPATELLTSANKQIA
jgi:transcriptional regulator with XRE-family HTH domain